MTDKERHADEVNIAFQMGAEWERAHTKARIEKLETALREIAAHPDPYKFNDEMAIIARCALDAK